MRNKWKELTKNKQNWLINNGSINWCGASKGLDLDPIILAVAQTLKIQDGFANKLKTKACYPHDYDYLLWVGLLDKLRADTAFWIRLYKIMREYKFKAVRAVIIAFSATLTLLVFGWKAFNNKQ